MMTDVNASAQESPASSPPAEANGSGPAVAAADLKAAPAGAAQRWPLSRIVGVALLILLLFSVAAMVAGGVALLSLHDNRERAIVFIAVAVGLAAIVVLLAVGLRATAVRPLHRLAAEARRVADGDFGHEVTLTGPREVTDLAVDV